HAAFLPLVRDREYEIGSTRSGVRDRVYEIGCTRSGVRDREYEIGSTRSGVRDRARTAPAYPRPQLRALIRINRHACHECVAHGVSAVGPWRVTSQVPTALTPCATHSTGVPVDT